MMNAVFSFQQASDALLSDSPLLVGTETLPLSSAHRRILAKPIIAGVNVPNADNSAMDGFAFRFSDLNEHTHLTIIGIKRGTVALLCLLTCVALFMSVTSFQAQQLAQQKRNRKSDVFYFNTYN